MATTSVTFTLAQLAEAGLIITQPSYTMGPGEWYCGEQGPFPTPEAAALAGITRIIAHYHNYRLISNDTTDTESLRAVRPPREE